MTRRVQELDRRNEFGPPDRAEPEADFVSALFAVTTLDEIALRVAKEAERVFGCHGARMVTMQLKLGEPWHLRHCGPDAPLTIAEAALVDAAVAKPDVLHATRGQAGFVEIASVLGHANDEIQVLLLADWPDAGRIPEACPPAW